MYPHFIIFDCSLLLNPEQAGCAPLSPRAPCWVWAEILLRREQDSGRINDMSYISLFRYVFTEPFVCAWVSVCVRVQRYVCLLVSSLSRQGPLTHQHVFLITVPHSSPPLPDRLPQRHVSLQLPAMVRYPMKPQRAALTMMLSMPVSICLSEEASLLKDGNVISWPLDPGVAALQTSSSRWMIC